MNSKKKVNVIIALAVVIVIALGGWFINDRKAKSDTAAKNSTVSIKDMDGNAVTIPGKVTRVGTSWPGFCNIICTVGGGNSIVATSKTIQNYPWSTKIFPNLSNIAYPFATSDINMEELIKSKPDVVFLRKGDKIDKVKEAGIPVVMIDYTHNNIADMINAVTLAGQVIGGDGVKKAQQYSTYYNDAIKTISDVTSKLTDDKKPKVIYLSVSSGSWVWGKNMPQDEIIKVAGGINAASEIDGYKEVSFEQLIKWDPDYIFIDGNPSQSKLMKDSSWKSLKAVKNNKVFVSPNGVFAWSRLGAETVLQLKWVAKTLYPDSFKDLDMKKETTYFYKTFFNYDLSDEQVNKILNAQNP